VTRKALFVQGGWDGHQPEKGAELFSALLRDEGFEVEISDMLDSFLDRDHLRSLDLIVPAWTMGTLSKEQEESLLAVVAGGVGIAGWHGTMADAFRGSVDYQFMVGGQFVAHPGNIIDYRVEIVDRGDPITAGLDDFDVHSEQYYMHVDPSNHVLATTTFSGEHAAWVEGTVMPVVWKRMWDQGRVFYCSVGHSPADLQIPEVTEMIRRGMLWASHT
jgi:uncharacterized protein